MILNLIFLTRLKNYSIYLIMANAQDQLTKELIIEVSAEYADVYYQGFEIMNDRRFQLLKKAVTLDFEIYAPNMPGSWEENFSVTRLIDAFTILSDKKEDVETFRKLFDRDAVGNTSLSGVVFETLSNADPEHDSLYPEFQTGKLDLFKALMLLEEMGDNIDLTKMTSISDEAAELLSNHHDYLELDGITELSDSAAESLSRHQGSLDLGGLTELSDSAVESLSKHQGALYLNELTELSDSAAESLSKHQGDLILSSLTELSDSAVESLSKHQGGEL